MSRRANPTVVGGFILGAVVLVVAAVVVFGSGRLFKDTVPYISWFEGSVNGLNVGAPVKFMGVRIGQVTDVRLRGRDDIPDTAEEFESWEENIRIPVFYELDRDLLRSQGSVLDVGDRHSAELMVQGGLRAALAVESILTGRKYIALSVDRSAPYELVNEPGIRAFEIPTVETGLEWLERDVQGLMAKLTELDVEGLVEAITGAANEIGDLASGSATREALADLPSTLAELRETLTSIQVLAARADTTMQAVRPRIDASSDEIQAAAEELDATLGNLKAVLEPGSPLLIELEGSLNEIGRAAAALRELADYLQQNPSALVRGKDVGGDR
ncbi:MAG: MlaD family protein [Candidatus Palauibacterales bacterium]|jgi:phospholipid/cholesterol/gamma-HCH transport system substrate-binding protein|nr:MlaD family protein [Candidatus Palauibacterales bacterium]MDP2481877.1 MlaD family protein [Candidatus Palauibacterales bacterium]